MTYFFANQQSFIFHFFRPPPLIMERQCSILDHLLHFLRTRQNVGSNPRSFSSSSNLFQWTTFQILYSTGSVDGR
ncbi:hypothetical protein J437_LFUL018108 [Ladona fulva]|uniref:Uncharacterized protein n=1 Tax=Ladona fulva TaxID=123851 RepID=A0A8K0KRJ4_LADFU|nr:hypothetical protein J437_LFUL018108 [Ladona fulva]